MKYEVHVSTSVRRYVRRLDRRMQLRVATKLDEIARDPFSLAFSKPLREAGGLRSARVGSLRIVFEVDRAVRVVDVVDIGPRGDIYRGI